MQVMSTRMLSAAVVVGFDTAVCVKQTQSSPKCSFNEVDELKGD